MKLARRLSEAKRRVMRAGDKREFNEPLFRSLFEIDNPNSIYEVVLSPDGAPADYRYLEVNRAFLDMVGMQAADLIGKTLLEVFPGTEPYWLEKMAEAYRTGKPARIEAYSAELKNYTDLRVFVPRPGLLAMSGSDITDRRNIEMALRASEEKYRNLVEDLSAIVFTLDLEGRFTYVSPAWSRILGHPIEEIVGKAYEDLVHRDDRAACAASYSRILETRSRQPNTEFRALREDGSWHWLSTSATPLLDSAGAIVGLQGVAHDIDDRKRMEDALRRKGEELDRYFNSAMDLLCIADTKGRFLRLNPEWEKVLGYPIAELEGKPFLDYVHPEDLQATLDAISELSSQRDVKSFVNRYRCRDGSWRWIEWRSRPEGELIYAAARDITERKLAEEEIRRLLDEKELILREVHHRIKNNMSAIAGLLSLQASFADEESERILLEAAGRVESMLLIYDNLNKSGEYQSISLDEYLPALVEQAMANCASQTRVLVEKRIEPLALDPKRMQVLGMIANELLTNALKYAFKGRSEGRIEVEARRRGDTLVVSIRDDGLGLPEGVDFEHPSSFGLSLVRDLTAQIKGKIGLERGEGTRISLEIPL